jgi:hypothetical protein
MGSASLMGSDSAFVEIGRVARHEIIDPCVEV